MTTDEVRQLAADLGVVSRNTLMGIQLMTGEAAAILERLADDKLATEVAQGPGHHTLDREGAILAYRKRVMGEET